MFYLKAWRLKKNISQIELARASGITQAAISINESGSANPTYETLRKLAKNLNISISDLFVNPFDGLNLDRHEIDEIAKNIISGELPGEPKKAALIRDIALLQTQKLAAANKPGKRLSRGSRWDTQKRSINVRNKYPVEVVTRIMKRVDKLLAS